MSMRVCTACGETKYLTSFYRHPTGLNGRESRCKQCRRAEIYATRELKREVYREQQRKRYATDPEYRERKRASHRAWVKTPEGRESRRITQRIARAFQRARGDDEQMRQFSPVREILTSRGSGERG